MLRSYTYGVVRYSIPGNCFVLKFTQTFRKVINYIQISLQWCQYLVTARLQSLLLLLLVSQKLKSKSNQDLFCLQTWTFCFFVLISKRYKYTHFSYFLSGKLWTVKTVPILVAYMPSNLKRQNSPEHRWTMICDGTIRSGMVLRGIGTGTGSSLSVHRWACRRAVVISWQAGLITYRYARYSSLGTNIVGIYEISIGVVRAENVLKEVVVCKWMSCMLLVVAPACSSLLSLRPSHPATATREEEGEEEVQPELETRNVRSTDKQNITFLGKSVILGIMEINRVLPDLICNFSCSSFL